MKVKKHIPLYSESPQEKKLNEIELVGLAAQLSGVSTEDFMRAAALDCAVAVVQQARKRMNAPKQNEEASNGDQGVQLGSEETPQAEGAQAEAVEA